MKKLILFAAITLLAYTTNATDLIVQENGPTGTYNSISAAITAAVNGNRIIINNRPGGLYWTEDININKSVQLLSSADTIRFRYSGNVTITPAVGREISIIGMENQLGSITASGASPAGTRTKINIYNCILTSGNIAFDYDYFDISLVSNILNGGNISIRFGKIIGNQILPQNGNGITINSESNTTDDTISIIANKIKYYSSSYYGLCLNSSSQYVIVSNNLFSSSSLSYWGIGIKKLKSGSYINSICNNSFLTYYAISFDNVPTGYKLDILNNVQQGYLYFIYLSLGSFGTLNVSYNYSDKAGSNSSALTNNGTNSYANSLVTFSNNTTLQNSTNSPAVNGAHPGKYYCDLDLSRGDAGCYGGSWTINNYFPITGSSRVYMINSPRAAIVGSVINIKADGFDR